MKKDLKIEAGKFYKLRNGFKAFVYRTGCEDDAYTIHGYVIRTDKGDKEEVASWTDAGNFYSDVSKDEFDIVLEWTEPLDFDWDCLPKWADRYITMDADGNWYGHNKKPKLEHNCYWNSNGDTVYIKRYHPKNFTGDWKVSLFENPKYIK